MKNVQDILSIKNNRRVLKIFYGSDLGSFESSMYAVDVLTDICFVNVVQVLGGLKFHRIDAVV